MASKYIQSEWDQLESNYMIHCNPSNRHRALNAVYRNKILVRKDYMLNTLNYKDMMDIIQEKFPNYVDWTRNGLDLLGEYEGYREPYKNRSIASYNSVIASEDMLSKFNIECNRSKLHLYKSKMYREWYSYKFDLVTEEVMLKLGFDDIPYDKPQALLSLPSGVDCYGITYKEDGTVCDLINCYVVETKSNMRKFCEDHNLVWSLPDEISDDDIFLYDIMFNRHTLELDSQKIYTVYK